MKLRFRYSLKVFLLIWLLIGLGLGWFGIHWQKAKQQAAAMQAMTTGSALYDYEQAYSLKMNSLMMGSGNLSNTDDLEYTDWNTLQSKNRPSTMMNMPNTAPVPGEPEWLIYSLGVDFFHPVTAYFYPSMKCAHDGHNPTIGLAEEMEQLAELPHIREFYLYPDKSDVPQVMNSSLFTNLGKLRELEELWLGGLPLKAEHLAPLHDHPKLKKLTLVHEEITDETLAALGTLPALEELRLFQCPAIGKSGLPTIAGWSKLHTIDLAYTPLDERILPTLAKLPQLEALNLAEANVSLDALKELRKLPHLKRLNLSRLLVTDAELAAVFKDWSNLETLDLSGSNAGELFASECKTLTGLKYLDLSFTPLDDEAFAEKFDEKLSEQLPGCKLELGYRGGLFGGKTLGGELKEGEFSTFGGGMGGSSGGGMGGGGMGSGGMGGGRGSLHTSDDDIEPSDETLDSTSDTGSGVF